MSTNKDIRFGMIEAGITHGELCRRVEERTGMKISSQYFSKTVAGAYHSEKAERVLRAAREILGEINGIERA